MDKKRQQVLDGIETLYPADAADVSTAYVGQVLLRYALDNADYNWRALPFNVLQCYLAICEDYERKVADEMRDSVFSYPRSGK